MRTPPPWLVATRTCLMLDIAIASARFACVSNAERQASSSCDEGLAAK